MTETGPKPRLMIIVASTRPGRMGTPVANWFVPLAREYGAFDVDVVDLAELDLPLLNEPNHPRLRDYMHPHTHEWSARVDAADAFVFVTPEYNHGYPAALKNAIDYLHQEWLHKPVAFVSYGGIAAGTRSMQQLTQVVTAVKLLPLDEAVNIPFVRTLVHDGVLDASDSMERAVPSMLDELLRVQAALRPLRDAAAQAG
jgi:NAD(P)H-dependent FMN reductase